MTTFLSLSQEVLLSLLSFCTACSIHGVQTREYGHTSRSPLDSLESAIGFHMRDWWQPTKANFFGHLKKPQIIAALNEAGLSGAARDAEKMKKGDAAGTCRVPHERQPLGSRLDVCTTSTDRCH